LSKVDEWNFEEIIASIEKFDLGTKIRSNTGDIYKLSQAEGEGKQRKFSRWDGTKLRFLTYENIGKKFEILEDNTKEIEEIHIPDEQMMYVETILKGKINELVKLVNELRKDKSNE